MTEFNLPLLRKAVEWAESENRKPEVVSEWYQGYFCTAGEAINRNCGTAYCIAGWVAHEAGIEDIGMLFINSDLSGDVAMELLGIDRYDAWGAFGLGGLFSASNTIEDVRAVAERIARRYGEEL